MFDTEDINKKHKSSGEFLTGGGGGGVREVGKNVRPCFLSIIISIFCYLVKKNKTQKSKDMIVKLTKELFNSVKIISISNLFLIKFYECGFSKLSEIKHQLSQNFPDQKT